LITREFFEIRVEIGIFLSRSELATYLNTSQDNRVLWGEGDHFFGAYEISERYKYREYARWSKVSAVDLRSLYSCNECIAYASMYSQKRLDHLPVSLSKKLWCSLE
jgi:hypothetical protein